MDTYKIGTFIRESRKKKNLTQKELADMLYISPKTVSKWETGRGIPDSSLMVPLSDKLDISVNELLNGEYILNDNYKEVAEHTLVELETKNQKANKVLSIFEKSIYIILSFLVFLIIFLRFRFSYSIILIQFITFGFICLSLILLATIIKHTKNNK